MAKRIVVLRVDPLKRNIAKMVIDRRPETICRMLKVRDPRTVHIMNIEENPLEAVCRDQDTVPAEDGSFKIRGFGEIKGTALLVGLHAQRACSVPVDQAWTARMIEWVS